MLSTRKVLFSTYHGSHLYGTAHSESDTDVYTVVSSLHKGYHNRKSKYAKQTIKDGVDTTVVDLSTFTLMCWNGVPQALEAMFSPERHTMVDHLGEWRSSFRVGSSVVPTYVRTIRAFSHDSRDGGVKKRRHALRLGLNASDILHYGRFCPTLEKSTADYLWDLAEVMTPDECEEVALDFVWS